MPPADAPAAWITEDVVPVPKNIYGVTKVAAENLCELFHDIRGLPCLILRTSRFFPEHDDRKETRQSYDDTNVKINEFLAYDAGFLGGVRLAAVDVDGDGKADILTGAGPGGGPHVQGLDGLTARNLDSFFAYDPRFPGGVFVGGR